MASAPILFRAVEHFCIELDSGHNLIYIAAFVMPVRVAALTIRAECICHHRGERFFTQKAVWLV